MSSSTRIATSPPAVSRCEKWPYSCASTARNAFCRISFNAPTPRIKIRSLPRNRQRQSKAAIGVIEARRLLHHLPIKCRRPPVILLVVSFRGGFERFDGFRSDLFKLLPNGPLAIHVEARGGL